MTTVCLSRGSEYGKRVELWLEGIDYSARTDDGTFHARYTEVVDHADHNLNLRLQELGFPFWVAKAVAPRMKRNLTDPCDW